jgi:hypothetical protein
MTEYEQQVADALLTLDDVEEIAAALDPSGHYADDGYLPEVRAALVQRLAPRVAAAIEALAKPWAADIEHEYGSGQVPDGAHYGEIVGRARELALAALRGEPT